MVNYAPRQTSLSEQASIVWWRAVIAVTRRLNRVVAWAVPVLAPLKPYWWLPPVALFGGFIFGLSVTLLLA